MSLLLGSEGSDVQVQPMQHDDHLFMRQAQELVRGEEERLRAQNRREAQLRRNKMRPSVRTGLSANFLEEREDDSDYYNAIVFSSFRPNTIHIAI
uniref:IBB domain-containing protein n=1 Tax=Parascaris univalens TaxID=6257 RepID=A0A915CGU3_PARUN